MVKLDLWLVVLFKSLGIRVVATAERFGKFFRESLVFAEFLKDGLMEKVLDVFCL